MNKKKKQVEKSGPPKGPMEMENQDLDIRNIMKEIEILGSSNMTWKERKDMENRKIVSLGGKAPKKQRLPLSVARPMMKKQKQREQKMLEEQKILGRFGGKHSGSSSKRSAGKRKPEDRVLKSTEGRFRNGVLDVKHLLSSAPV
ncbi:Axoneme-associated protein MST101(2) protein [Quillaja saponaria]|uniref:Axoneme-associated protein MST101(2) protein n=1 Tax=Quillaja saponaria TaxID=32244 RepID=A0AAD7LLT8_QUISA|nr:Axoneme-associated protein MST101(2) protein [Quillaja saponaria]